MLLVPLRKTIGPGLLLAAASLWSPSGVSAMQDAPAAAGGSEASLLSHRLALPVPSASTQSEALARLEEAVEEWSEGDRRRGALLADSALSALPVLDDWRPLVRAELLAPTADTARVRATLEAVDRSGEIWSRWGWRVLVEVYEEAEDLQAARNAAHTQARVERNPGRAADAWLQAGRLALEAGDSLGARADLGTALEYGPSYGAAREAGRLIDRMPWRMTGEEEIRVGRTLLASREWERGYARLGPHIESEEMGARLDRELRIEVGRALVETGRFAEAEAFLRPLIPGDDAPAPATTALYWTGRAQLGRGAVVEAAATFRRLAEVDPHSILAERGLSHLLSRELETGFGPRARRLLDELLDTGVDDSFTRTTVVQLGTTHYLSEEYSAAASVFERYLGGTGSASGRQQAGYWAALTHERAGNAAEARAHLEQVHEENPFTFYGGIAGERLGTPVLPAELADGPDPTPGLEDELENALIRLRVLRIVPTPGSFAFEVDRLTRHFSERGADYELAEALIEGGFPLQAIVLGRSIREDEGGWNLRLLRIVHPFPHRDTVVRLARAAGLNPFFVAGLIRQESAFDAAIESVAGAVGLMQLMPATAREVAGNLGIAYTSETRSDPDTNLRLGIAYLAEMVRRFERTEDVLSAYNAGPGRMREWQANEAYGDPDVFGEHIPFEQTRDYVRAVQGYARVYTALYGCGDFEACLGVPYRSILAQSALASGAPRTERTLD